MSGDDIQIWMEGEVNREIMVFIITTIIIITTIPTSATITLSTAITSTIKTQTTISGLRSNPRPPRVPCAHQRQHDRPLQGTFIHRYHLGKDNLYDGPLQDTFIHLHHQSKDNFLPTRPREDIITHTARRTELQHRG